MEIALLAEAEVPEAAKLYIELVHYYKEATHDPYFDFDVVPSLAGMREYLEEDFRNPRARVYIVKDRGAIVGLTVGRIINCFPPFKIDKVGLLGEAYLQPAYRRQGIMRKLEALLIEFFQEQGVHYVELEVLSSNKLGKETWTALGYRTYKEYMRKEI
jgi:ribosomal protein S18 acetylase RimI-like enzyme